MSRSSKRFIPPLNPLRFFEVVARTLNLTSAAKELNVTQSAVSRQISVLEGYLGVDLFRRERLGVKLTPAGARYAERIIPAVLEISEATRSLVLGPEDGALRIRSYTTFATQWLLPRLSKFEMQFKDIPVEIVTGMRNVDFTRDNVDLSIETDFGETPEAETSITLFHDSIDLVCSPSYRESHLAASSTLPLRLLFARYSHVDWENWLATSNAAISDRLRDAESKTFGISLLAWRAAAHGLGIAVGQLAMLTSELGRGELIRPFDQPMKREAGYRLLCPKIGGKNRRREIFCDWLMSEARETRHAIEKIY